MDFYALNVSPLNGYETQFAAGISGVSIGASGDGSIAKSLYGHCSIDLCASANAALAVLLSSHASINITVDGIPSAVYFGIAYSSIDIQPAGGATPAISLRAYDTVTIGGYWSLPKLANTTNAAGPDFRTVRAAKDIRKVMVTKDNVAYVSETKDQYVQFEER